MSVRGSGTYNIMLESSDKEVLSRVNDILLSGLQEMTSEEILAW